MTKSELRKEKLNMRKNLDREARTLASKVIFEKVVSLKEFEDSNTVLIYLSYNSEVETRLLIEYALATGKNVCVPVVQEEGQMIAVEINSFENLVKNRYDICEPKDDSKEVSKKSIDLAVIPGTVFDAECNRIGYGKGYFDNFLKGTKIFKVALAFDEQIADSIPVEANDVKMDMVITPTRVLR